MVYVSVYSTLTVIRKLLIFGTITLSWLLFRVSEASEGWYLTAEDFKRARSLQLQRDEDGTFLTQEDFERAQVLSPSDLISPNSKRISLGKQKGKFHGDIVGKASWSLESREGRRRNGVRLSQDKWTGGKIPYVMSNRYSQRERAILARSIQAYHQRTCVKFVPRSGERDYVYIGKIDGCFSDVGRAGGRQEVSLDDGCVEYDTAIHELMHAVGFWHEHERWDRDDFINILWANIDRDAYDQFGKVNLYESSYYGEGYDYYSIMHYDRKSFTKNGRDTMTAKQPVAGMTQVIGRVQDFSARDLNKINKLYNCGGQPSLPHTPRPVVFTPRPVIHVTPSPPGVQPQPTDNGTCRDKATLCWRWVSRCRSPFFEQIMRQFCAGTCGFCFSGVNGNSITNNNFVNQQGR